MYRFQYITEFNKHQIDERDKKVAKTSFHIFDRLLSMDIITVPPSTNSNKEQEATRSKADMESATKFVNDILNKRSTLSGEYFLAACKTNFVVEKLKFKPIEVEKKWYYCHPDSPKTREMGKYLDILIYL